jgi:hypothetical protein
MGDDRESFESESEWRRTLFILLIIAMIVGAAPFSFWLRPWESASVGDFF